MKKSISIFYIFFIVSGALSLVYVPDVFSYPYVSEISIIIILLPTFIELQKIVGVRKTVTIICTLSLYALTVEYIGLVTGWPYGLFTYNPELGGKIFGVLPWTVGLSYTTILLGCIGMAYTLSRKKYVRIFLTVLLLLLSDLILDPGAVAIGMWSFVVRGHYYSVPFQNFIGWVVTGIPGAYIGYLFLKKVDTERILLLTYSFCMSMSIWVCIAFLKMLWVPFMLGLLLISTLLVLYYLHEKNHSIKSA